MIQKPVLEDPPVTRLNYSELLHQACALAESNPGEWVKAYTFMNKSQVNNSRKYLLGNRFEVKSSNLTIYIRV